MNMVNFMGQDVLKIGDSNMEKIGMWCWKILIILFRIFYFLILVAAIYTIIDIILHC